MEECPPNLIGSFGGTRPTVVPANAFVTGEADQDEVGSASFQH
jgi:hypothetical protein